MPIDENFLTFCLGNTFQKTLGVELSDDTEKFIKAIAKKFSKLSNSEKIYYNKYALQIVQSLSEYLADITRFEINMDESPEIVHDFKLFWGDGNVVHISMAHSSINVKDVIPKKLMKICKYKRNTNICKMYNGKYKKINDTGYKKVKSKEKYSAVSARTKSKYLLEPVYELVLNTLSKKRKCAANLYKHLFCETDRLVLKLYKNRFTIYDFGKELDAVESFRMKYIADKELVITFNNKVKFSLVLQTNGTHIKENLSLKFHTSIKNMDELFAISNVTI